MTRHWSINGRFLTQPFSGVQRYAFEILRELDHLVSEGQGLARDVALELLVPRNVENPPQLRSIPIRAVGPASGHVWEQAILPGAVRGGLLSLCNTGPIALTKQIVCLHDVNTRIIPESYSRPFRALYRVLHPALGRRAAQVTTVSHYSARQLIHYGIAAETKLRVIPNGHEHALRWQPRHSARTRAAAGRETIFVLGSPAPHKNIGLLLGLAGDFAEAGLRLAIAGMSDSRVFKAAPEGGEAGNVIWLGRVSDDEIAALLGDCLCLAFPSFVEGFGLPAVEAMAWSCPSSPPTRRACRRFAGRPRSTPRPTSRRHGAIRSSGCPATALCATDSSKRAGRECKNSTGGARPNNICKRWPMPTGAAGRLKRPAMETAPPTKRTSPRIVCACRASDPEPRRFHAGTWRARTSRRSRGTRPD
jgi:glycosyltransferase involved in cell wall biosynthesis